MPRYDYRCPSCDLLFEVQRSFADTADVLCPACSAAAKKVFSPAAVVFKGSGFHNTDYRPRPSESSAEAAPSCPAAGAGGGCVGCPAQA